MARICWLVEELLAPQERLCSMGLACGTVHHILVLKTCA